MDKLMFMLLGQGKGMCSIELRYSCLEFTDMGRPMLDYLPTCRNATITSSGSDWIRMFTCRLNQYMPLNTTWIT